MLDKSIYINHLNQKIEFGSDGLFITGSNARNYEWQYDTNYDEITNFRKGVVVKNMTIFILKPTKVEAIEAANNLHAVFERDVLAEKRGKLIIDGYYCKGYFIASEKPAWNDAKRYMTFNVKFASDSADWISESTTTFKKITSGMIIADEVKRYPNKYPYRYSNENSSGDIINHSIVPSDFIIRVYGAIQNPIVSIAGHPYQVNVSLDESEYMEINSKEQSIIITKKNGEKVNAFWNASRQGYIFEKIPSGRSVVSWDGSFSFDVIVFDTRSEPLWM